MVVGGGGDGGGGMDLPSLLQAVHWAEVPDEQQFPPRHTPLPHSLGSTEDALPGIAVQAMPSYRRHLPLLR